MTKKVLVLLIISLCCYGIQAKTDKRAKAILDKTASTIKKAGDIEADFKAESFKGEEVQGHLNGTLFLHGKAFHLIADDVIYWYDGKTMWTYVRQNNEVNISTPDFVKQQSLNPYTVISIYRKGYEYEYGESTLRGKSCYCIHLKCIEKTQNIKEMYLDIDKESYHPMCIRFRRGTGGWTRVTIKGTKTNQNFEDSKFTFNKSDYPSAEIIDLR